MSQLIQQFLIDVFRLTLWLGILAAVFVPLERLFGNVERGPRSPIAGEKIGRAHV